MKVFGFAAFSGSGKTTLIENVLPLLVARGLRVSVIKHAHHAFDVDQPGKDSYRHRQAGASEVLISSGMRWALMHELRQDAEPGLPALLERLSPCDLVLVEGFKRDAMPKLEIHRLAAGTPLLYRDDPDIVALATDAGIDSGLPCFALDDYEGIAGFMLRYLGLAQGRAALRAQVGDNWGMKPDDSRIATIQVLYFARLRETFGREREQLELPADVRDIAGLTNWLCSRGEPWSRELAPGKPVRVAVNQDMASAQTPVSHGDEVAFFPPVTGG